MKRISTLLFAFALTLLISGESRSDSRDWSLVDTRGETFSTASQLGDAPALLLFWATWCAPCKQELDAQKAYFESLVEKGVHVIMISEDNPKTQAKVKPYVDSKGFTFPVLLDPTGEVLKRYGGTTLPFSVILDKDGKSVQVIRGAIKDTGSLTQKLDALLGGASE